MACTQTAGKLTHTACSRTARSHIACTLAHAARSRTTRSHTACAFASTSHFRTARSHTVCVLTHTFCSDTTHSRNACMLTHTARSPTARSRTASTIMTCCLLAYYMHTREHLSLAHGSLTHRMHTKCTLVTFVRHVHALHAFTSTLPARAMPGSKNCNCDDIHEPPKLPTQQA